jgi:hypothetical protein
MSLLVYPSLPGLTLPVLKSAGFDTLVSKAPNAYRETLPQTINPEWSWQFIYDFLRDPATAFSLTGETVVFTVGDMRTLFDFFLFQSGQAGDFLLLDPDDNYVGPAMVSGQPNIPLAQLQVVTDGTNWYSPLQRTFGGLFYEDITDLNTSSTGSTPAVYRNGTLASVGWGAGEYQIEGPGLAIPGASFMGMYLNWGATEPAAPVTAQFNFYFRAHFESDMQDMEKFAKAFWTIGGSESQNGKGYVKLAQSRPNPL